ncbi:SDR family oxidoreductase [Shewanella sp.]|nr:SDR family oxidoreductase [Shewanella sp.]
MNLAITGYTGFVGTRLLEYVDPQSVTLLGRRYPFDKRFVKNTVLTDLASQLDFKDSLSGIDVVIHLAGRAHIMGDSGLDSAEAYWKTNTSATLALARQAAKLGVKRFIFVSSIKVNGESTELDMPFTASDAKKPVDFYGQSKSEAESQLLQLAKETGLEVVIIRPTLVYGPGVKANFASLLKLVSKGLPLPFGCIKNNKRSLVSVKNLVHLIITCIDHPKAVNQVFLVSDDHDVSTASMVKYMSHALGKSNRLLPVPLWCYRLAGKLVGKSDVVNRLIGSLQVDISHTKDTLGWIPPQTLEQGFRETVEAFIRNKK